jgi:16S rRNA (cytosine967-C5)-methyltransferase
MPPEKPETARPVRNSTNGQHPTNPVRDPEEKVSNGAKGKISNGARIIAAIVLNRFDPEHGYAGPILNEMLHQTDEKQRATDLVFGTIRNCTAIDMVIARLADCPVERIPAKLLNIIRIGAYELIYSPQTGEYAIVNEAVENAGTIAGKKQTGFVNAILRQITRHIQNRQVPLSQPDVKRTLPQTPTTGCEFDTCFLPDLAVLPAEYLGSAFSLPKWLLTDWLAEFGYEKTKDICFASNRKPSVYIRPNGLRTTPSQLAERLRQENIEFEIVENQSMIKIKAARAVPELPGFDEGLFSIQDIMASQPVILLRPEPAWTILDLCAAPGVKTTQLAELTGDKAKIVATDIDRERLEKVRENIDRLGLNSINIVAYEGLKGATGCGTDVPSVLTRARCPCHFDCILLDVPCSNTGVLAKRIETRYRIRPKAIRELTKIQGQLLQRAATMIKSQGKICYSTCSIQKDENSRLVHQFLEKNRNFTLEVEKLTLPSTQYFDHDGGYVAIIANTK